MKKRKFAHEYKCPECGEEVIKDPKNGQFVFTCTECKHDWFIIKCN